MFQNTHKVFPILDKHLWEVNLSYLTKSKLYYFPVAKIENQERKYKLHPAILNRM